MIWKLWLDNKVIGNLDPTGVGREVVEEVTTEIETAIHKVGKVTTDLRARTLV